MGLRFRVSLIQSSNRASPREAEPAVTGGFGTGFCQQSIPHRGCHALVCFDPVGRRQHRPGADAPRRIPGIVFSAAAAAMRAHVKRTLFVATLGVAGVSCADSTGPTGNWQVDIGLLLPELSRAPVIAIPQNIVAGEPINVVINTFGSSTCIRAAGVIVEGAGSRVQTLTPLDSVGIGQTCTDDLAQHPHPVVLTFSQPGEATVRVRGYVRGSDLVRRLDTIEAVVTVR